jgi:hypothetical protein
LKLPHQVTTIESFEGGELLHALTMGRLDTTPFKATDFSFAMLAICGIHSYPTTDPGRQQDQIDSQGELLVLQIMIRFVIQLRCARILEECSGRENKDTDCSDE